MKKVKTTFSVIMLVEEKINKGEDLFNRNMKYKAVAVDESFPEYIVKNKEILKDWII